MRHFTPGGDSQLVEGLIWLHVAIFFLISIFPDMNLFLSC